MIYFLLPHRHLLHKRNNGDVHDSKSLVFSFHLTYYYSSVLFCCLYIYILYLKPNLKKIRSTVQLIHQSPKYINEHQFVDSVKLIIYVLSLQIQWQVSLDPAHAY